MHKGATEQEHLVTDLIRADIDSATVDSTIDRAPFPNCRQACFTVDSDKNTVGDELSTIHSTQRPVRVC